MDFVQTRSEADMPSARIEWFSGWLREQPEGVVIGPEAIPHLCRILDLTAADIRDMELQVAVLRITAKVQGALDTATPARGVT